MTKKKQNQQQCSILNTSVLRNNKITINISIQYKYLGIKSFDDKTAKCSQLDVLNEM